MNALIMPLQILSGLLFSMVAGSVFGIWRGYNPQAYSAETFVEVHQGAVRGLNALLPGLALVSIAIVSVLAWLARGKVAPVSLYLMAAALMVAGGVVTRFFNQPINAQVMTWTIEALPASWAEVRDTWWTWHLVRTGLSLLAMAVLLAAIVSHRPASG